MGLKMGKFRGDKEEMEGGGAYVGWHAYLTMIYLREDNNCTYD